MPGQNTNTRRSTTASEQLCSAMREGRIKRATKGRLDSCIALELAARPSESILVSTLQLFSAVRQIFSG